MPGWPQLLPPLRPSADGCRILRPGGLLCWPPSFRGVMSFVARRPITESNRPPSYQASTNEPESNRHFLCWWPEVIPAYGMARGPTYPVAPEKIIVAAKSLFTCFRITTAHSPTRSAADGWLTSPTYSPKRVTFTPPTLEGSSAINRTSCWPPLLSRGGQGSASPASSPSCCALATSTRPSLSPSRCWLVLRQHRSACGYCCATDV